MAHYAFITNGIVTEVIGGIDETELIEGLDPETWYGNLKGQLCKRTSYTNSYRYNYAGIGYTYDPVADAFHAPDPKCHDERILDLTTYRWTCFNSDHLDHDVKLPE
jgi:hypothetical protein